jgi:hypoxanthine phosphoribosyltransferase
MEQDFARILISRDRIQQRVRQLAESITQSYGDDAREVVIVAVLSGSIIFLADLMRYLPFKMKLGLMTVSRYRGATTLGGETLLKSQVEHELEGRHVLLIDDILDSGGTIRAVAADLRRARPASLKICVLLRKPAKAPKDIAPDFVGFDIEDVFVVGYGLDYNSQYRNWPDIGVLRPELYA